MAERLHALTAQGKGDREGGREGERQRQRDREEERDKREGEGEGGREGERERERKTETERDRERETETDTRTDRTHTYTSSCTGDIFCSKVKTKQEVPVGHLLSKQDSIQIFDSFCLCKTVGLNTESRVMLQK